MINSILNPKTIAVIGASEKEKSVGRGIIENLKKSNKKIFFVNPNNQIIFNKKTYPSIIDIKDNIDLAIIAVPKKLVEKVVQDCIFKKVNGVIIISAGFAETGKKGRMLQEKIAGKLKKANIILVGPNCLGVLNPSVNFNASFSPTMPKKGNICLISQSGALINSIIDGSEDIHYGFSLIFSVGNAAGLKIEDYIKIANNDINTKVIALYIEGLENGRNFLKVLNETKKPVIVLKGGKIEKTKKAISSHTGSLAGEYRVFSDALRQFNAFEVNSLEELFDFAKILSWQKNSKNNIGIVTNGGGAGILLSDEIYKLGLRLPKIKKTTLNFLDLKMHAGYSKNNPLDIVGDACSKKYELACGALLEQKNINILCVIQTLQIMTDPLENAKKIVELSKKNKKPIITVFMGNGAKTKQAIKYLEKNKIPNYSDPKRAAKAIWAISKNKLSKY